MTRPIATLLTALLISASLANADEGFSAGASVGRVNIETNNSSVIFDEDDTGWKVFGAYMLNKYFGIEGGYVDFGTPDSNILGPNLVIDADGLDLFGVGAFPLSESFSVFGKIGLLSWDAEIKLDGVTVDVDDGTDVVFGIGGDLSVSDRFAIRGEIEWFDIDDSGAVWMFSLGGMFRF